MFGWFRRKEESEVTAPPPTAAEEGAKYGRWAGAYYARDGGRPKAVTNLVEHAMDLCGRRGETYIREFTEAYRAT
jgi:hypothetical protein